MLMLMMISCFFLEEVMVESTKQPLRQDAQAAAARMMRRPTIMAPPDIGGGGWVNLNQGPKQKAWGDIFGDIPIYPL